MKKLKNWIVFFVGFSFLVPSLDALDLHSKQAILIDLTTGKVLFEKNPDDRVPPSSMSKLMTVFMIFEALKAGEITKDTLYVISEKAWRKGGSKMFVKIGDQVSVDDLLRGVVIQSGNDASITLAEGYAGSEEGFAEQMTKRAMELGATNSTFMNATGWPDPAHLSTVRDLALIGAKTIEMFPDYYPLYKEVEFSYNNITQGNRNPLLYRNIGADGLKTGHTDLGGYGVVGSAVQGGRRLILAINGAVSSKQRALDAEALMGWGFTAFSSPHIFSKGTVVDKGDVWIGQAPQVTLMVDQDVFVTVPRAEAKDIKVELVYQNPIEAPIQKGQVVGKAVIKGRSFDPIEVPLVAGEAVERAGFFSRIKMALQWLLWGHN